MGGPGAGKAGRSEAKTAHPGFLSFVFNSWMGSPNPTLFICHHPTVPDSDVAGHP